MFIVIPAVVLVFGAIIFVHELGHFIAAKLSGVKVDVFAMGFGPRLLSYKGRETTYALCIVPLGGYVKMAGETPWDRQADRGFRSKPVGARLAIVSAGPLMNFLLALVVFWALFMIGMPDVEVDESVPVINDVLKDSPAEEAGILPGDIVLAIDGQKVNRWDELSVYISGKADEEVNMLILRDEIELLLEVIPRFDAEAKRPLIGITVAPKVTPVIKRYSIFEALKKGAIQMATIVKLTFVFIPQMITGQMKAEVAGPIGIAQFVAEAARIGFTTVLFLLGIISTSVGLFNLLPIPILDGGHMLIFVIEGFRGKAMDPDREGIIYWIGMMFILFVFMYVTYSDILRIWSG